MLNITALSYHIGDKLALTIEQLTINQGDSYLVVGDNASGKSILVQILAGCIKDYQGKVQLTERHTSLSFELVKIWPR